MDWLEVSGSMRVTLLPLLLFILFAVGCSDFGEVAPAADEESLTFLVLGDWGMDGGYHQRAVASAMANCATSHRNPVVLSVGDNFYSAGVRSVDDPLWRTSFEDVYSDPALQIPWYVVLGNHDYYGNAEAQVEYTSHSNRWNLPDLYYTHLFPIGDGHSLRLIALDGVPLVNPAYGTELDNAIQLAWADSVLALQDATWTIVTEHYPLYSGGEHGSNSTIANLLEERFQQAGVVAVFSGHDHDLEHLRSGGIDYYVSGAGAVTRSMTSIEQTVYGVSATGFLCVQVSPDTFQVDIVNHGGDLLHSVIRTR